MYELVVGILLTTTPHKFEIQKENRSLIPHRSSTEGEIEPIVLKYGLVLQKHGTDLLLTIASN